MAPTIEELEAMSDAEVRAAYNQMAKDTVVGMEWYREELRRRALERQTNTLVKLTWVLAGLTAVSTLLVLVTVLAG